MAEQTQSQTRFHGEVKVQRNGVEIRVNVFDENRDNLYLELQHAIAQFSGDPKYMNQAQLEIARAEQLAAAIKKGSGDGAKPFKEPAKPTTSGVVNKPICQVCRDVDTMKLIEWQDEGTGEARRAWKCQACGKWAPRKK